MKVYKDDSPIEMALQEIEALMQKLGVTIDCHGPITISLAEAEGRIVDVDMSMQESSQLPRFTDSERIVIRE